MTGGAVAFVTEDGLTLEGEIRRADGPARAAAVICHPHPLKGGSKDHPLLWAVRNDLAARGFVVLAFNFRGVMGSQGDYGGGVGELGDVRAAVGRIRQESEGPTLLAGWSFGAHAALREAVDDDRVAALALVGMPLVDSSPPLPDLPDREHLRAFDRPVLLVAGEADQFCPLPDLRSLARRLPDATVHVVRGTDHFLWKHEREAAAAIGDFAEGVLAGR
jgi:alpha/beta superfamily hydrolase